MAISHQQQGQSSGNNIWIQIYLFFLILSQKPDLQIILLSWWDASLLFKQLKYPSPSLQLFAQNTIFIWQIGI